MSPLIDIPIKGPSWPSAMIIPEAVMNPDTTGCDRKFATKPNFSKPNTISMTPPSNASVVAAVA